MANPRLLLLDEVSLGLSPVAVDMVYRSLETLIASSTATVVLVEQDLRRAMDVSGRIACMLEGRIVLAGASGSLTREADHRGLLRPSSPVGRARVIWVNAILAGVLLGGLYALFACGLSLMYGVMRIINLAHGDLAVLGAYLVLVLSTTLGAGAFVVLPLAVLVMAGLGYVLQRTLLDRSLKAGPLVPLLTTFGLAIVIQNLLLEVFSARLAARSMRVPSRRRAGASRRASRSRRSAWSSSWSPWVCSLACSCSCRGQVPGGPCVRRPRIQTRPSSSASTRGTCTRWRPPSRSGR